MAKTDWQLGDTVQPEDLNQLGQEINQNRDNLAAHTAATTGVHGATSAATPNTLVQRDPAGRFKAAAPSASDDVARKAEVDAAQGTANAAQSAINAHVARTDNPHGTTAEQVGAPSLTTTIPDGVSLNTVVTSGFYRLSGSHPDAPPSTGYGQMIVSRGGDTVFQIVTGFNHSHYYMRHGNPPEAGGQGVWQPWRRLWHDGNDGAGSGLDADTVRGYVPVNKNGDTMNGEFTVDNPNNGGFARIGIKNIAQVLDLAAYWEAGIAQFAQVQSWDAVSNAPRLLRLNPSGGMVSINDYEAWHKGNLPYETGTWTPELRFDESTAGITYALRAGRYTRIANVVYWTFTITLSSKGSASGIAAIYGLPFNNGNAYNLYYHAVGRASNISVPSGQWLTSYIVSTVVRLATNNGSAILSTAFADNSSLSASGFYFI